MTAREKATSFSSGDSAALKTTADSSAGTALKKRGAASKSGGLLPSALRLNLPPQGFADHLVQRQEVRVLYSAIQA